MTKIAVVVPTNRPEKLAEFEQAWSKCIEEAEARLYVVKDEPETWKLIQDDLGRNAWVIPVKTDCIRSYGFLKAAQEGADVIVTLDDDVKPINGNPILDHVAQLDQWVHPHNWTRTLVGPHAPPTRGLPELTKVVVSHGLWKGSLDVSAKTQLAGYYHYQPGDLDNQIIPRGQFYPMSGMNLAFNAKMTPIMYFGLMGSVIEDPEKTWGVHRMGDIFAGVVSKAMIDLNPSQAVHSGDPVVDHTRASDPIKNAELESKAPLFSYILAEHIKGATSYRAMAELIYNMGYPNKGYTRALGEAMRTWWELVYKG